MVSSYHLTHVSSEGHLDVTSVPNTNASCLTPCLPPLKGSRFILLYQFPVFWTTRWDLS